MEIEKSFVKHPCNKAGVLKKRENRITLPNA